MKVGVIELHKMERINFENVCTANLNIYILLPTVWLGRQWIAVFFSAWPSERSDRGAVWGAVKGCEIVQSVRRTTTRIQPFQLLWILRLNIQQIRYMIFPTEEENKVTEDEEDKTLSRKEPQILNLRSQWYKGTSPCSGCYSLNS